MKTVYFVKRNDLPLLGTARETEEQALSLCKKIKEQYDNGEYSIGQFNTYWDKKEWNNQLISHYMVQRLVFGDK